VHAVVQMPLSCWSLATSEMQVPSAHSLPLVPAHAWLSSFAPPTPPPPPPPPPPLLLLFESPPQPTKHKARASSEAEERIIVTKLLWAIVPFLPAGSLSVGFRI